MIRLKATTIWPRRMLLGLLVSALLPAIPAVPSAEAAASQDYKTGSSVGLNLTLSLAKQQYLQGEPVFMKLTLRNQSRKQQTLPPTGIENSLLIAIRAADGKSYNSTSIVPTESDPGSSSDSDQYNIKLKPDADLLFQDDLLRYAPEMTTSTGQIRVTVTVDTTRYHDEPKPWKLFVGTIVSNTVTFNVVKPMGVEAEVSGLIASEYYSKSDRKGERPFPWLRRFVSDNYRRATAVRDRYPDSLYSAYLTYYLGDLFKSVSFRKKSIEEFSALIPNDRKTGLLPLASLGVAYGHFSLEDYAAARSAAQLVQRQFPRTFAAQEAAKLLVDIDTKRAGQSTLVRTTEPRY